jgi:hypothetical protein
VSKIVAVDRFLKQRAVNVAADGHYTLSNWYDPEGRLRTLPCRTNRISPFRAMVDAPVVGKIGDKITSYFQEFGKLDGHISATKPGVFLLELTMAYAEREKLANKLIWLEEKLKDPEIPEQRQDPRMILENPHSTVTFANGAVYQCVVIDISVSGVAVTAEIQPEIATPLAVGACVGRVVRTFPNGFAVQFLERQKLQNLDRLVTRAMLPTGRAPQAPHPSSVEVRLEPIEEPAVHSNPPNPVDPRWMPKLQGHADEVIEREAGICDPKL